MSFRERLNFAWQYIRKYQKAIVILIISVTLFSLLEATIPYLSGQMIDAVLGKKVVWALSFKQLALVWFVIITISLIFNRLNGYYSDMIELKAQQDLVLDLSDHVLDMPIDYHYKQKGGTVHQVVGKATDAISTIFNFLVYNFLPQFLRMIVALIVMCLYNLTLASFMLATAVLYFVVSFTFKAKIIEDTQREVNEYYKKISGDLGDALTNIFSIKAYNGEELDNQNRVALFNSIYQRSKKLNWAYTQKFFLEGGFLRYSRLIILASAVYMLGQNKISTGDLLMSFGYLSMVIDPLSMLANQINNLRQRSVNLEEAAKLRQIEREQDFPDAKDQVLQGNIEFKNVVFTYPDRDGEILNNVSFNLPAGKILAIFGETGSGKTTIYNLLLRLYNHIQGQILLDGIDANKILRHCIRRQLAVVPQDPILFHESILFNIRYGKAEATLEEVMEATKQANAHDFIEAMPKGYHTIVGERGVKLSGGQVQRLAIARAFLRNPKIMLLDEATSSLDTQTKFEVLSAMRKLIAGRTAIIISHDFSAITMSADQIIVMDNGRLVQTGTHDELISKPGVYLKLWQKELELREKLEQV